MTFKEYDLLLFFVHNKEQALSRKIILDGVWGYDYYGDLRTVDTHVKRLRQKLSKMGEQIKTVRGLGYRFEVKK
ncbi:winged helix-turn-helix domain-containing protein [Natronincola ferrireducens]|uniref:Transcriptional regulatory protein, C terminal n=1 Tax=Natronincola ferrireducens TaxID=393762 RepID=A0A1G9GEP3_9FIRM|nr:helix-turn-helix domain-containing protein [Natronincola ferrireducens]SDK98753.1 Transcriptional regulatory protein, C terminal [Natronincola ferrireducens]